MQDILIVVDMQKDFVDGSLGTAEAVAIVPAVAARLAAAEEAGETVIFTRDTHEADYLNTQEGKNLPVEHCIRGSEGWQIIPELRLFTQGKTVLDKPSFGSMELAALLRKLHEQDPIGKITLVGLCTDICVISNALLAKASLPEVPIAVDAACCAGVTPQSHDNALAAMKMCQIAVEHG